MPPGGPYGQDGEKNVALPQFFFIFFQNFYFFIFFIFYSRRAFFLLFLHILYIFSIILLNTVYLFVFAIKIEKSAIM